MTTPLPTDLLVYGMGQLGRLFADGALRLGLRVMPVVRSTPRPLNLDTLPPRTPLLVAVGEDALAQALTDLPPARRSDVVLLQNLLFPAAWRTHGITDPTVMVVWTARKADRPPHVARPTAIHGPHADTFAAIHGALGMASTVLGSTAELYAEIVAKFAMIITINALGIVDDVPLGVWLQQDGGRIDAFIDEARRVGEQQVALPVPQDDVRRKVREAMAALPDFPARSRLGAARIRLTVDKARHAGLAVPALEDVLKRA